MQRWKEYYEQLLNEEFDWNKDSIGSIGGTDKVEASVDEREISVSEVRLAITKAKSGKAAGATGVTGEKFKGAGGGGGAGGGEKLKRRKVGGGGGVSGRWMWEW